MLDSRHWKQAHTAAAMPYHLDGDAIPTTRTSSRRSWISTAEGVVDRAYGNTLLIAGEERVSLRHSVPSAFDMAALLGRRVRVTLLHIASLEGGLTQTLTVAGSEGGLLLIAHAGEVSGVTHGLGSVRVYVALSQRPGGPMVLGTARVQSLVRAGDHIRVRDGNDVYVLCFEERIPSGARYAIGAEEIWRGPPSTMR